MLKSTIKIILRVLFSVALLLLLFLGYMTVTDYRPQEKEAVNVENNQNQILTIGQPFSILTFNIGYCGLDKKQDFFMDGGTMSRSSSKSQTLLNLNQMSHFISKQKNTFTLLQEVDIHSLRSNSVDELQSIKGVLKDEDSTFALNYKVPWVPVPLTNPMGNVQSGIATFSRNTIKTATRFQYPGAESWPRQLFELDRCFVANRIPVSNHKELVLINSHLSAFDKGGEIRKIQLDYLKKFITSEFAKGNYVIVGGDWNHVLPGTDPSRFKTRQSWPFWLQKLPDNFTPQGFKWGSDGSVPSVRTDDTSYKKDVNFIAVIDGFLVSPNVDIKKITGYNLEFENSDHNPVSGVFILK